jgi:hypothetical protein
VSRHSNEAGEIAFRLLETDTQVSVLGFVRNMGWYSFFS